VSQRIDGDLDAFSGFGVLPLPFTSLQIAFWKLVFSIDYGLWTIDFIGNCFLEIGIFHGLWSKVCGLPWKLFFGNWYFPLTMVYGPLTSLEIVLWK
jgi:hypothetical protein